MKTTNKRLTGDNLRRLRKKRRLTQEQLAERLYRGRYGKKRSYKVLETGAVKELIEAAKSVRGQLNRAIKLLGETQVLSEEMKEVDACLCDAEDELSNALDRLELTY